MKDTDTIIKIKRIYDVPSEDDGKRILIDRLWPRGISKEKAQIDIWLKDAAPSTELRKWYGHSPEKHEEFSNLYEKELSTSPVCINAVKLLKKIAEKENLTLLYAAKDEVHNHAIVLLNWILNKVELS